jgi:hypothetical protein
LLTIRLFVVRFRGKLWGIPNLPTSETYGQ